MSKQPGETSSDQPRRSHRLSRALTVLGLAGAVTGGAVGAALASSGSPSHGKDPAATASGNPNKAPDSTKLKHYIVDLVQAAQSFPNGQSGPYNSGEATIYYGGWYVTYYPKDLTQPFDLSNVTLGADGHQKYEFSYNPTKGTITEDFIDGSHTDLALNPNDPNLQPDPVWQQMTETNASQAVDNALKVIDALSQSQQVPQSDLLLPSSS